MTNISFILGSVSTLLTTWANKHMHPILDIFFCLYDTNHHVSDVPLIVLKLTFIFKVEPDFFTSIVNLNLFLLRKFISRIISKFGIS